jgi:glutamate synthase (NADPH/NADH) small chain
VTVFEKNGHIGGLLRRGIPDFKLDKSIVERRVAQMEAEGVVFRTNVLVGPDSIPAGITNDAKEVISAEALKSQFDAVILSGGSEVPRDLPVPGRELGGVHFALEFLIPQNKEVEGGPVNPINVKGKHVVVIGGGDTGSDCVGTSNRHGAASITQFEVMPMPPEQETSRWCGRTGRSSCAPPARTTKAVSATSPSLTKGFVSDGNGRVKALQGVRLTGGRQDEAESPGSEFEIPAMPCSWPWVSPTR